MIKANVNRGSIKVEAIGTIAEIMTDLHNLTKDILDDSARITNGIFTKQHLLTMLYQNILKEWSAENENE